MTHREKFNEPDSPSRRQFLATAALPLVCGLKPWELELGKRLVSGGRPVSPGALAMAAQSLGPVEKPGTGFYLQAGGRDRVDPAVLRALRDLSWDGSRIDVQGFGSGARPPPTADEVAVVAQDALEHDLTPLVIVRDADQIAKLPSGAKIEVRNEPDIDTNQALMVSDYVKIALRCIDAAHRREQEIQSPLPIYIGAVSNLNERGLGYLKGIFSRRNVIPPDVGVTVHRYPNGGYDKSVLMPQDGFNSREDEVRALRDIIGTRHFGVSELGYHTAARSKGWWFWQETHRWTDEQVADNLRWEFNFWTTQGAMFCTVYQLNDGPNPNDAGDTYGIRRIDGTLKPSAYICK